MPTMLESVLFAGAGLADYSWILPLLFFVLLGGGLWAYFKKEKGGFIGSIAGAMENLAENPYKLLAYTAGILVFLYIMAKIPAIPYVNIITGIALYSTLAIDMGAWIASVFKK